MHNDQLFINQIRHILRHLEVNEQEENLFDKLTNDIYMNFYVTGGQFDSAEEVSFSEVSPASSKSQNGAFIAQLDRSNHTADGFDEGWRIEEVENGNTFTAGKGNYRRQFNAGDFIRKKAMQGPIQRGDEISFYRRKKVIFDRDIFYYLMSQTVANVVSPVSVRFYFNVSREGIHLLIDQLSFHFNKYQIPFDFKCLNDPDLFGKRADSAVMYLEKRYVNFGFEIFNRFYPALREHLQSSIPLFTLPVYEGIAFAESPPNPTDSFGQSRAKVIAKGIENAIRKELPRSNWLDEVIEFIRANRFDLAKFYLNPNSNYRYPFNHLN